MSVNIQPTPYYKQGPQPLYMRGFYLRIATLAIPAVRQSVRHAL